MSRIRQLKPVSVLDAEAKFFKTCRVVSSSLGRGCRVGRILRIFHPGAAQVQSRFRVSGFGFQFLGFGFRASGFGLRASGFGFRVSDFGLWVPGSGFRVSGFGFRVSGFGLRPLGRRADGWRGGGSFRENTWMHLAAINGHTLGSK